jgi:hypothetical protein
MASGVRKIDAAEAAIEFKPLSEIHSGTCDAPQV